jgi:hypothetical protein
MRSAPNFWKALRKRRWITLKSPSPNLMNSDFITAWSRAHQQQERNVKRGHKRQSAKRKTYPARYANSKRPRIMMGECTGHKSPKSHSTSRNSWKGILRRLGSLVLLWCASHGPWDRIEFDGGQAFQPRGTNLTLGTLQFSGQTAGIDPKRKVVATDSMWQIDVNRTLPAGT